MPLCRIVYCFNNRLVKLKLNNQLYQYVIFNRKYSSNEFNYTKDWFFHPKKGAPTKSIKLTFNSFIAETIRYENTLFKELLEELNVHKTPGNELRYFFSKDISHFKYFGIELDRGELTRNLVQHLDDFPFDMTPIYYYEKCKRHRISIRTILTIIEAQYLAHKLDVELKVIFSYLKEMRSCIFHYKSMRSVKRNLNALLSDKYLKQMSISSIIFFLNSLRPFSLKQLSNVEESLVGISWEKTPATCPSLVKHSYQSIMFRIRLLKDMGFTNEQIRLGLPYLGIMMSNLSDYLNYILAEFGLHKDDKFFLRLLGVCYNHKRGLKGMVWQSYEAIQRAIDLREEKRQSILKSHRIICFLQENLGLTKRDWKIIRNHPAVIVENRVLQTLNLLEERGFTKEEILESIPIILYPRHVVEKSLIKVKQEEKNLKKFGLANGCVKKMTTCFAKGTKLKRKTLQLCLYYIEKKTYVSEEIVLEWD